MDTMRVIGPLTQDETAELAAACLNELPQDAAIPVVVAWMKAEGLTGEDFCVEEDNT